MWQNFAVRDGGAQCALPAERPSRKYEAGAMPVSRLNVAGVWLRATQLLPLPREERFDRANEA